MTRLVQCNVAADVLLGVNMDHQINIEERVSTASVELCYYNISNTCIVEWVGYSCCQEK